MTPGQALRLGAALTISALNAPAATRYVNLNNPAPAAPYTNWATAAVRIQDAVDAAVAGEEILVTNGVYQTGARALNGMSNRLAVTKPVTVRSVSGPSATLIVGYRDPGTPTGTGPAAVRCAYLVNGALLAGFTLTNGATQTDGDSVKNQSGGGVWCQSASAVLTVSLVAEMDGRVIGHIAFSPVTLSDGTPDWYGLGPVSVLPACQRQGIGKALMQEGLARLREMNARGCCLVGHPDYYRKFGFKNVPGLAHEGVPPEVFFALSFDGRYPQGTVAFHEGFKAGGPPAGAGQGASRRT